MVPSAKVFGRTLIKGATRMVPNYRLQMFNADSACYVAP